MKIAHISDTHGYTHPFAQLDADADVIVHSGDFCPNFMPRTPDLEKTLQEGWIRIQPWKQYIGERPMYVVQGNHDWADIARTLRDVGVDAHDLHDSWQELNGIWFAGYKYVPRINNYIRWNNEADSESTIKLLREDWCRHPADVLVTHSPIFGVLDDGLGSTHLRSFLDHCIQPPRWLLHGHIHHCNGQSTYRSVQVSNAATTVRYITL